MNKRRANFQDAIHQERLTGGDYCAGRNLLAYAVKQKPGVVLKDLATGEEKMIAYQGKGGGSPRFSWDGTKLLFLAGMQLCVYDLDADTAAPLGDFTGPVIDPMWSPDGSHILFASSQSANPPAKKARKDEPIVIEDFGYKFDGAGYIRPDGHTHLFVVETATGKVTQLTHGVRDELHHNWSPDGQWIVYAGNENRPKEQSIGYDLYLINLQGEKKQISKDLMIVSYPNPIRPVFTPDGKEVVMGVLNPRSKVQGYPDIVFFAFPTDGGEPRLIFEASETCYQCVQFPYNANCGWGLDKVQASPDGQWVYFVSGWKGQGNVYKVALQGEDHHAVTVLAGKHVYHGLGRIQDGKMLAAKSETNMPEAYYLLDTQTDTLEKKIVQSAPELYETVELPAAEDFFFDTMDGESTVHGWVQPPAGMEKGKKYPAILYVHGGPHPFYTYGLTMEHQAFAGEGFGVLYCNPRGSSGYGPTHQNIARSKDGCAYMDLLQFVDEAIRRYPWIDPDRLGVTGGSYGGYMTNYIATHAQRFKAYITQRSVVNELIEYASADLQGSSRKYKNFEEFMVDKLKESTVSYAERINKPFLILHGMDDYRTPVEGAHQLFVAVKDTHPDLPVKMVLFPHTHHEQPGDPKLLTLYYKEMVDWFKKYL